MQDRAESFRRGLFSLQTRRFGTSVEVLSDIFGDFDEPKSIHHDRTNPVNENRVEVKGSKVLENNGQPITRSNLIQQCLDNDPESRPIAFEERENKNWDCNIQQIKRVEFEELYYVLFFRDKVCVFCINSDEIAGGGINYSDKQHKGNEGEGQFHITNKNINYHLENYLFAEYSYEAWMQLLEEE